MFTSWATVQHCVVDFNECELSHSDGGGKTCVLNEGQIREIMHTGSRYHRSE